MNIPDNFSKNSVVSSFRSSSHSWIEVGTLIVVIALFYIYMVSPKKAEVAAQNASLTKISEEEKNFASEKETMDKKIGEIKNHSDEVRHLDESLPLDWKVFSAQSLVEKLATDAGVAVSTITLNSKSERAAAGDPTLIDNPYGITRSLQTIPGSIYVSGTFGQLKAFIQKIESSARFIDILDLGLSSSQPGVLDLRLDIQTYYYE